MLLLYITIDCNSLLCVMFEFGYRIISYMPAWMIIVTFVQNSVIYLYHLSDLPIKSGQIGGKQAFSDSCFVMQWVETFLSTTFRKKSGDEKQLLSSKLSLPDSPSHVCFALCTGAFSDPVVTSFLLDNLHNV